MVPATPLMPPIPIHSPPSWAHFWPRRQSKADEVCGDSDRGLPPWSGLKRLHETRLRRAGVLAKPGTRLRSVACGTEVVVVRAPDCDLAITCCGAPMVERDEGTNDGAP